jgi:hypothetical protein
LFSIHQFLEGTVWLSLVNPPVNTCSVVGHALNAFIIFPIIIPFSVLLIEPCIWRRKILCGLAVLGCAVAIFDITSIPWGNLTATSTTGHIIYSATSSLSLSSLFMYVLVTCGSALMSSYYWVRVWSVASFIGLVVSYIFYIAALASIWCFFSALLSVILFQHFRTRKLCVKDV